MLEIRAFRWPHERRCATVLQNIGANRRRNVASWWSLHHYEKQTPKILTGMVVSANSPEKYSGFTSLVEAE
jgi:hypothetical protein